MTTIKEINDRYAKTPAYAQEKAEQAAFWAFWNGYAQWTGTETKAANAAYRETLIDQAVINASTKTERIFMRLNEAIFLEYGGIYYEPVQIIRAEFARLSKGPLLHKPRIIARRPHVV